MTSGLHYFILAEDGSLKRLRIGTFERVLEQKARLPAHRGKTVKLVEVGAEVDENDVPVGVYRMTGSYLTFDEEGVLDRDAWMESAFQAVSGALSDDAPVVDLKSARVKRKHRWKPTPAERAAIVAAVIGHPKATANETAVRLQPYEEEERMAPKRRKLNWEARQALDELRSLISSVQLKVGFLREEDLESFHEAALEAAEDADDRWISPHWRTIAEQALFRSGIAEAYRTGSGEWYAAIEAYRMTQSHVSEEVFIEVRKFPSLDEATTALREMMPAHLDKITAQVRIEARTVPAAQWEEERPDLI